MDDQSRQLFGFILSTFTVVALSTFAYCLGHARGHHVGYRSGFDAGFDTGWKGWVQKTLRSVNPRPSDDFEGPF